MKKLHGILVIIALGFLLANCGPKEQTTRPGKNITTLLLVRHAEKAVDGTDDPPLAKKGKARAELLKNMLSDAGITAIYTTPFQRNVNTVKPLADSLGLQLNEYPSELDLVAFMGNVIRRHKGEKVLVCGHSTTIPAMLNVLVQENIYTELGKQEYDDLFVVTVPNDGKAVVTCIKYQP